jgi:hypothetical protein
MRRRAWTKLVQIRRRAWTKPDKNHPLLPRLLGLRIIVLGCRAWTKLDKRTKPELILTKAIPLSATARTVATPDMV